MKNSTISNRFFFSDENNLFKKNFLLFPSLKNHSNIDIFIIKSEQLGVVCSRDKKI